MPTSDVELPGSDVVVREHLRLLLALVAAETRPVVTRAFVMANQAHAGQTRDEGTPYILHPLRVATLLAKYGHGAADLLAAALLHDTLEDTELPEAAIAAAFSPYVAALVRTLTRPSRTSPDRETLYHRQLLAGPPEARVLKVADRLDNLTYLHLSPRPGKADHYLQQTVREVLPLLDEAGGSLALAFRQWWSANGRRVAGPERAQG